MASAAQVDAVPGASVTTAAGRVATGSRASWSDRIEGTAGSLSVGLRSGWRPSYEQETGQQTGFDQGSKRREQQLLPITPFIAKLALGFQISAPDQSSQMATPILLTDWLRGVARYEFNMRIFADATPLNGSVINRYS